MHAGTGPDRPAHSRLAWVLYAIACASLAAFLVVPYNEIWIYPSWDEDLGSNGWQLLTEAWQLASSSPASYPVGFTVSIAFGLLTAFSVVCIVPTAGLLWFAGHSRVILWLGRIWWSLMVLPGLAWFFLLEHALRTPGALEYLHREGMVLYWIGGLGAAVAFWLTGRRDRSLELRVGEALRRGGGCRGEDLADGV